MEEFRRGGSGFSLPPHIAEDAGLNGTGRRTGGTAETFHQHGWAQVHGFLQKPETYVQYLCFGSAHRAQ